MIINILHEFQKSDVISIVLACLIISISVIFILIMIGKRRKKRGKIRKKGKFWLEIIFGQSTKHYSLRSFLFVLFLFIIDILLNNKQYSISIYIFPSISLYIGLIYSRYLYHKTNNVFLYIEKEFYEVSRKEEIRAVLNGCLIFIEATGKSPLYQGFCCFITIICFIFFYSKFAYHLFPSIWSRLFCFIILTGILGPICTAISGFILYSQNNLSKIKYFELILLNNNKLNKMLGRLALSSSLGAAITGGIAISIFIKSGQTELVSGFTFFLVICVSLFLLIPLYYIFKTTKKIKNSMLNNIDSDYALFQNYIYNSLKKRSIIKEGFYFQNFLLLNQIRLNIVNISEWPIISIGNVRIVITIILPIIIEVLLKKLILA